jgi:cardiolipin synthase
LHNSSGVKLPKPRNLIGAILLGALIVAAGLVIAQDQETLRVRSPLGAADPRFPDYLARLLGHPLTTGDSYIVHTNGDAAFPAMVAAIERAMHRISFETYIFDEGRIAQRFTGALADAARRGVDVRLVLDSMGAKTIEPEHLKMLEDSGCRVGWFNQIGAFGIEEVNYRTHRKALVVDGDVAFVGGIGVADQWAYDIEGYSRWRDTQIELHGPAAINVEAAFNENWIETGGIVEPDLLLHDREPAGKAQSIVVWSSPEGGTNAMKLMYLLALAAARESLDIQSPYLILDKTTKWSIQDARQRGVRVRMLMEGEITDAKPVKFAGRADYEWLLEQGIELFEYQPAMMHAKALIVDGVLSIFGSANFDNRSFELNDELNIAVFDRTLASRLLEDFERDLTASSGLELDAWRARPAHVRAREKLWSFFGEVF